MLKFAFVSFLFLQVAFSREIQGGASLNVQGSVKPSLGEKFQEMKDSFNQDSSGESSSSSSEESRSKLGFSGSLQGIGQAINNAVPSFNADLKTDSEAASNVKHSFHTGTQDAGNSKTSLDTQGANNGEFSINAGAAGSLAASSIAQGASSGRPSAQGAINGRPSAQDTINGKLSISAGSLAASSNA